ANLLVKFRRELEPDRWALAWDGPGPTFRHELYPAYKENRPAMPEELSVQLTPIEDLARCLGLPVVEKPGMEADDVMATLARAGHAAARPGPGIDARRSAGRAGASRGAARVREALGGAAAGAAGDRDGRVRRAGRGPRPAATCRAQGDGRGAAPGRAAPGRG